MSSFQNNNGKKAREDGRRFTITTDPTTTNRTPNHFNVSLDNISYDTVVISWTLATDPENDAVSYKIFINDQLKTSNYIGST